MEAIDNKKFGEMFDYIKKLNAPLPSNVVLAVLAGIVNSANPKEKAIADFASVVKDRTAEEITSSAVLFACNSVVINIYNMLHAKYGDLPKEKAVEKVEAAPAKEAPEEITEPAKGDA